MKKRMYIVGTVFAILTLLTWVKKPDDFSASERRKLGQFPQISWENIQSGLFMQKFETYTTDQFPARQAFRTVKAATHYYVLGQQDNHGVFRVGDQICKLDVPYRKRAMERAVAKFTRICDSYMKGTEVNIYTALIPDKNYFLAEENHFPSIDYESFYHDYQMSTKERMQYIELRDLLTIEDYYMTDTHWRQERIVPVARHLGQAMGVELQGSYEEKTLKQPFYGVYYGQLALPVKPDRLTYLEQPDFSKCKVYNLENQQEIGVYNQEKGQGRDPYELFLSGSLSAIRIENPAANPEKELVLFRDSFGSSITPLLIEGYGKITLLDIRYLNERMIPELVTFDHQDVLFLYSTGVINSDAAF